MFRGPLFIVGAPRSGTKLLLQLVSQHPRLGIPLGETEFLPHVAARWDRFGDLSDRERFRDFYAWMQKFIYFRGRARQGALIGADEWYDLCRDFTPGGVFEALVRHDADVPFDSDRIWCDKSPTYMRSLPLLHGLYPDARFLHIIRDGRDVALSSHQTWNKSMLRSAQRWVDDVRACRAAGAALGAAAYHEIRFEELVADTEEVMRGISRFLDVDYDPAMLEPVRPTEYRGSARGQARIVKSTKQRWVDGMPARTRRRIEGVAGPLLEELGYPLPDGLPPHRRLSRLEMLALQAADGMHIWGSRLRTWGIRDVFRYGYRTFIAPR